MLFFLYSPFPLNIIKLSQVTLLSLYQQGLSLFLRGVTSVNSSTQRHMMKIGNITCIIRVLMEISLWTKHIC